LKIYTRASASRIGHPIYFNFSCDIFNLASNILFGFNCDDKRREQSGDEVDEKKVRYLIIAKYWLSPLYTLYTCAALFLNLERLIVEDEKDFGLDFGVDYGSDTYTFDWAEDWGGELRVEWAALPGRTG
jgi:hypothetical protein